MSLRSPKRVLTALLLALAAGAAVAGEYVKSEAQKVVDAAITAAGKPIPAQAEALARLAWPEQDGDPEVAELARVTLINYRDHALSSIRRAIRWARPDQQAQVVSTLISAFLKIGYGRPSDFLAGLNDAAWYGTREARLVAIPELGRFRFAPAVVTIIDAAYEDPAVVPVSIAALGAIGNVRARFFLEQVMLEGDPEVRGLAASALARIGDEALLPLKVAIRSGDADVRVMAVQALLPMATVDDLSTLHEYVYAHPDDDPATVEAVRMSAIALENLLAGRTSSDSASSD